MPLPISKNQLKKLGQRLAEHDGVAEADFDQLEQVLDVYAASLDRATPRIALIATDEPASRVKNTGTIREKLRRGGNLGSMQDLAGARIVVSTRAAQDQAAAALEAEFNDAVRAPISRDRRAQPSAGYRAVHLVVFPDDLPIEIQVRTRYQHRWAELFEKFADLVGRDVRYGGEPFAGDTVRGEAPSTVLVRAARHVGDAMGALSNVIAEIETRPPQRVRIPDSWLAAADRGLLEGAFALVERNLRSLESAIETEQHLPKPPANPE